MGLYSTGGKSQKKEYNKVKHYERMIDQAKRKMSLRDENKSKVIKQSV